LDEERRNLKIRPFEASGAYKGQHKFICVLIIETLNKKLKTLFWQMRFFKTYRTHIITQNPDLLPFSMLATIYLYWALKTKYLVWHFVYPHSVFNIIYMLWSAWKLEWCVLNIWLLFYCNLAFSSHAVLNNHDICKLTSQTDITWNMKWKNKAPITRIYNKCSLIKIQ